MTNIEQGNDASLADFTAGWDKNLREAEQLPVMFAVMALTNFGEKPVPSGVERVDPAGAVAPILPPQAFDRLAGTAGDCDATVCAQCPFYSSAEAAQGWLATHPGGRVFPVREAWDLSFHREWRDRISALLNLDN